MSFNSFNFWLIYPFIFGIYWFIPGRFNQYRKAFLVLMSYLLYMSWKPAFALVLLGVSLVTYCGGRSYEKCLRLDALAGKRNFIRTSCFWLYLLLGASPLLIFKYYNFFNENIVACLDTLGLHFALPGLNCAVPIGISFFTFQSVGYMLDVYHGRVEVEKNLLDYLLFVCFFPQVTAGPISRLDELMPQIKAVHAFKYEQARHGLKLLLWGMFIKLVIADRLGLFVDAVYSNYSHYNGSTCILASLFYSIQIYCDFSGYSLMAIGLARTLGFNLPNNFRRPYFAVSITDFWRRWHITLTQWLTRQVYFPLGGSNCGKARNYLNILLTFLVSGIWHGANWTFIVWGCIHGVLQIIEKYAGWQKYEGGNKIIKVIRILLICMLINIAWIFFRMPDVGSALGFINHMFQASGRPNLSLIGLPGLLMSVTGLVILMFKDVKDEFFSQRFTFLQLCFVRWSIYVILFCMIIMIGVLDGGQFIYAVF